MKNILITGARGNVGREVMKHFIPSSAQRVWTSSRNKSAVGKNVLYFDFKDLKESVKSLEDIDVLFLLRPPDIADVKKYFTPLIRACKQQGVKHIIFLSVQGADTTSYIPHAKIEKIIVASGINYTFIRPSYFMQNLTTTLLGDIKTRGRIFLPAGNAPFLWVDVEDVGRAIAEVLKNVSLHQNKTYTITGNDLIPFGDVAKMISDELNDKVNYISPSLARFYRVKRKQGLGRGYIMVMIMLHYLPRFQRPPHISNDLKTLVHRDPVSLKEFIQGNKYAWM
jgi:uncharacterized protein YbjT (DUF2867 family)